MGSRRGTRPYGSTAGRGGTGRRRPGRDHEGGSDFWRRTSYGFIHDDGHALLAGFPVGAAVEVTFEADLTVLYDQAGVLVRVDEPTWIKAGVEATDGSPHLGAVVTHGTSDWSMAPVPEWAGGPVTVRVSRSGDALTVRARSGDGPWRMVRLAHLSPDATATAGPFCCSVERGGLEVRFTGFLMGRPMRPARRPVRVPADWCVVREQTLVMRRQQTARSAGAFAAGFTS